MMTYKLNLEAFHKLLTMRGNVDRPIHASLVRWIDYSTGNGFYHVFRNSVGGEVGYMIWAQFNDESVRRLLSMRQFPLYRHEWDEGIVNCILDIYHRNGRYRLARSDVVGALPGDVDKVAYVHRDRLRLMRRVGGSLVRVQPDQFLAAGTTIRPVSPENRAIC